MLNTLYVSDLDGTLLQSDGTISRTTAAGLQELIHNGLLFTYATARSIYSTRPCVEPVPISLPIITYNGTFVQHPQTGEIIYGRYFSKKEANDILQEFLSCGASPLVYGIYQNQEQFRYCIKNLSIQTVDFLTHRVGDPRNTPVDSPDSLCMGETFYFTCIGTARHLIPVYQKLKGRYNCIYSMDMYTRARWLEVLPKGAGKAEALRFLKAYLHTGKAVAFGDGVNDLAMFAAADESYAVSNASEKLKAAATGIIESNDNDGVLKFLQSRV